MKRPQLIRLGQRVLARRKSLDLSQEDLAGRADLHVTYVSGVENGRRNVSFTTLLTLALALELSVAQLTDDPMFGPPRT